MPRNGQGIYSLPPNTAAVAGQTIESAPYNTVNNDIANDLNAARPITAGGTGATNAADALANLGGVGQSNFLAAFAIGDFYETVRNIAAEDGVWLRRDGGLYDSATYPDLAALLPALPDGVDWTNRISGTTANIQGITYDGARYFGVGGTSVISSTNGEDWLVRANITGSPVLYDIAYGASIYVAADVASGNIYTSPDGDNWFNQGVKNATGIFSVVWAPAINLFVAVGGVSGGAGWIGTSPDGSSWTTRTSGITSPLQKIRYFSGTLIAVGNSGVILTSTNATAWTARTSGVSVTLRDAAFDGTTYVITGASGTIISSTNLSAWTPRTSGTSSSLNVALASSAGFLVAGDAGVARIASNVSSWNSAPTGISGQLLSGIVSASSASRYFVAGPSQTILDGQRTLPTQFRVPNDAATYGWIKAKDA